MYDTIVMLSPFLEDNVTSKIESFCDIYTGKTISTQEEIYEFKRGQLDGSFDYRISLNLVNWEWVKVSAVPEKIETEKYRLKVEFSLHKFFLNHNVVGGPRHIRESIRYFVFWLAKKFKCKLPCWKKWEIERIDVAQIYELPSKKVCEKIISNLRNSYYTRRKSLVYDTSIMFPGSLTTVKFYHKGPEFLKHDYKRLNKWLLKMIDSDYTIYKDIKIANRDLVRYKQEFDKLKNLAMKIVRFEVSISKKLLKQFWGDKVYAVVLDDNTLHSIMLQELQKLVKENDEMKIVRNADAVSERIYANFNGGMATALFGTWSKLAMFGEKQTRGTMTDRTYYRHRKLLIETGCSWTNTDVVISDNIVPAGFSFFNEKYINNYEDEKIKRLLKIA